MTDRLMSWGSPTTYNICEMRELVKPILKTPSKFLFNFLQKFFFKKPLGSSPGDNH